jgi:hypothetical protein
LRLAYGLLDDILSAWHGRPAMKHRDIQVRLTAIAQKVSFHWIERTAGCLDELAEMARRNIQKVGALDAMIINLRNTLQGNRT